jgi:TATA-box binding protein (TBP) (component of TFIID and TFIIIB)
MSDMFNPKISTMTFVAEAVDLDCEVRHLYKKYVDKYLDEDFYIENKDTKRTRKGKFLKSFGNQITIKSKEKKFNVKLFYNKKIQITGVKSDSDVAEIFQKLKAIFNFEVVNVRMVMKNVSLKISDSVLNLYNLYAILISKGLDVYYSPEIYPGLKLKSHNCTSLIFATGNVIISTKDNSDLTEVIDMIRESKAKAMENIIEKRNINFM